ncbi:MAG: NAD(P)H-dependent glycerol-3-phosphate dehydrogenase [Nocardioidaceae bacterium]
MSKVAVFGAGSWGSAFSLVLADAGNDVTLWARRAELSTRINERHENSDYLPGVALPAVIRATSDSTEALDQAHIVVLAVPSQSLRPNLERWVDGISDDAVVVSLMKGIELGTAKRMSEVIEEVTGITAGRIAVLSGPNLSHEIAERQPAASVIACTDAAIGEELQARCHTAAFRPYTNTDVIGCELGGATKNVIALAAGMTTGLGYGDNTTATVITRGLAETARLGVALGADPYTFSGLAGLGDLVAPCSSQLSRNRTFGEKLGRGMSVAEIADSTRQVAEGVKSCSSIRDLAARVGIEMLIVEHVAALVEHDLSPRAMLQNLISRTAKPERS